VGAGPGIRANRVDRRVIGTFAGSAILYYQMVQKLRAGDFEIVYRSRNRFIFMDNGFTLYELEPGVDLADCVTT
jgi:hypothetical protein